MSSMQSSCIECLLCSVIGNKGTADIFVLHCGPYRSVLCLSCHGGISPDRLQAFRLRYTARLQCHLLGMAESDRHKAHQCTQSLTGFTCLLALAGERAEVCGESTLSRVCTHQRTPVCRYYQARGCHRGSSLPCVSGCRHCLRNP